MEKDFIPYEEALALKELGFDEPCLAFYDGKNAESFYFNNIRQTNYMNFTLSFASIKTFFHIYMQLQRLRN